MPIHFPEKKWPVRYIVHDYLGTMHGVGTRYSRRPARSDHASWAWDTYSTAEGILQATNQLRCGETQRESWNFCAPLLQFKASVGEANVGAIIAQCLRVGLSWVRNPAEALDLMVWRPLLKSHLIPWICNVLYIPELPRSEIAYSHKTSYVIWWQTHQCDDWFTDHECHLQIKANTRHKQNRYELCLN